VPEDAAIASSPARVALAWAFVGLPLLWGVVMTLEGALPLFGCA
jgi:hypothetical protein